MAGPVVITDPADYWQLRALTQDVASAELDAVRARDAARKACHEAAQKAQAFTRALAKKYGLDPDVPYAWDDATRTLTARPSAGPQGDEPL